MTTTIALLDEPLVGIMEVGERLRERRGGFFLAGPTMGTGTNKIYDGKRLTEWRVFYDRRIVYFESGGIQTVVLDVGSITELSAAFDTYMMPTIAYRKSKKWYVRFYDPFIRDFITTEIGGEEVVNVRLCYDDKRLTARRNATVVMAYYIGNELIVRTLEDNFASTKVVRTEETDENYLSQISMGDNGRLQFVTYTLVDE